VGSRTVVIRSMASASALLIGVLLAGGVALAQGTVTPSFGDGLLTLAGEGYRAGEKVEITVRVGDTSYQLTVVADGRGRFRLATGVSVPPLSSVSIEARDEQGQTQAIITSAPATRAPPAGGAGLPPSEPTRSPTQLPRTGVASPGLAVLPLTGALLVGVGLLLRRLSK
jgi:hypothetical protein